MKRLKISKRIISICLSLFIVSAGIAGFMIHKTLADANDTKGTINNTAPSASFGISKKKKANVVLRVGSVSNNENSFLQSTAVQYIKTQLNNRGIETNIPSSDFTSQTQGDISVTNNSSNVKVESTIIGFQAFNNYAIPMIYTKQGFADITTDDNQALLYPSSIGSSAGTSNIYVRSSYYTGILKTQSFSIQSDNSVLSTTNSPYFKIRYSISELKYVKIEILTSGVGNFDAQIYYDTDVSRNDSVPAYSTSNGWYIYNSGTNTKAVGIAHDDNRVTNATAISLENYGNGGTLGRTGFNSYYTGNDSAVAQYYAGHKMGETISTLIGIERPTDNLYNTKAKIIADGLKNISWDADNRFTIIFNDKDYTDIDDEVTRSEIASYTSTNNTQLIFAGNSSMPQSQSNELGKLDSNGYDVISNDNQTKQLDAIVDYITNQVNAKDNSNSNIFLVGDEVAYNEKYSDYENDKKNDELWSYIQDPKHLNYDDDFIQCSKTGDITLDNDLGIADFATGQWMHNKVTKFDKPGKYKISLKVQDDPTGDSNFNDYDKWSPDDNSVIINVHRKPTPIFTAYATANAANGNFDITIKDEDKSYDIDHQTTDDTRKGIVNKKFQWKEVTKGVTDTWHDGKLPSPQEPNKDFLVKLEVQDLEGQWSDPLVKYITTKNENLPPIAQFTENETEMPVDQLAGDSAPSVDYAGDRNDVIFKDNSYDPNGDTIEEKWTVKDSSGNIIYTGSTMPTASTFYGKPLGTYTISLSCDDGPKPKVGVPLTSDPYTLQLTLVPINHRPIAHFKVDNTSKEPDKIKITEDSSDPDGDPIDDRIWTVTDSNGNVVERSENKLPDLTSLDGTYTLTLKVKDNPKIPPELWSKPYSQQITVETLKLTGTLCPNPAKQGQQITFDLTTTGNAKYLRIYLPDDITSRDTKGTVFPIAKTIKEEYIHNEKITYTLPINTPVTLDSNGNRVRPPYEIPVNAQKENGANKSITLYLDVSGNVLDGIKTEIIGTGQDKN